MGSATRRHARRPPGDESAALEHDTATAGARGAAGSSLNTAEPRRHAGLAHSGEGVRTVAPTRQVGVTGSSPVPPTERFCKLEAPLSLCATESMSWQGFTCRTGSLSACRTPSLQPEPAPLAAEILETG